jgi:hypothetical protein
MDWSVVMITTVVAALAMVALQLGRSAVRITGEALSYVAKATRQSRFRIASSSRDNSLTHSIKH